MAFKKKELKLKYGRLTVISRHNDGRRYSALCQCDCGSPPRLYRTDKLISGWTQSCGCLQRERVTIHGQYKHRLFSTWLDMVNRCENPEHHAYKHYGGRGISVCNDWHNIFNFINDMYPTYKEGLEIDRINNNDGYYPGNCRWSTKTEQMRNRRTVVFVTYKGETKCIAEWAKIIGMNYQTLRHRLRDKQLPPEKAFIPV